MPFEAICAATLLGVEGQRQMRLGTSFGPGALGDHRRARLAPPDLPAHLERLLVGAPSRVAVTARPRDARQPQLVRELDGARASRDVRQGRRSRPPCQRPRGRPLLEVGDQPWSGYEFVDRLRCGRCRLLPVVSIPPDRCGRGAASRSDEVQMFHPGRRRTPTVRVSRQQWVRCTIAPCHFGRGNAATHQTTFWGRQEGNRH